MSPINKIKAFVAHSFAKEDSELIDKFLKYFNSFKEILEWEHAEDPQPKGISEKIKGLMKDKNLFIGIFTKKYSLRGWKKKWLPSLWIVQESGYAIGKDLRLLFLVEDVIKKDEMGGLQGDYELVFFSSKRPEDSFEKINHMVFGIYKELAGEGKIIPTAQKEQPEDKKKSELDLFDELMIAIEEKDPKEEQIYNELIASKPLEEIEMWESLRLSLKTRHADEESFKKLKNKAIDQKRFYPNFYLGKHYEFILKDYKQAQIYFKNAFEYAQNFDQKLQALEALSECLCNMGNINGSYEVIISFLNLSSDLQDGQIGKVYRLLGEIAKLNKDDNLFLNFSEKALEFNPHDNDLRFELAYKYSEVGEDELAIQHYKILSQMAPSGAVYNNLGVSYEKLNLSGLSISSYFRAKDEYNNTLAMANLAYEYINSGFLKKAEEILKQAKEIANYHSNVDSAFQKLQKIEEEEKKKEEEVLNGIRDEREFRIEYGHLYTQPLTDKKILEGKWKTPHYGEIILSVSDSKIKGEAKIPEISSLSPFLSPSHGTITYKNLLLDGEIKGATAKCTITIQKEGTTLLTSGEEKFNGLMLFYCERQEIKILEWGKEGKRRIYIMKKIL
jgi:tetratricopeptide (TPR) repeat protein